MKKSERHLVAVLALSCFIFVTNALQAQVIFTRPDTLDLGISPVLVPDFMGCAWGDYDGDGYLDLFLPTGVSPSRLYRNDLKPGGTGRFVVVSRDSASQAGAGFVYFDETDYTQGAVWADFDGDGRLDLLQTNGGMALYHNDAAGFTDITSSAGVLNMLDQEYSLWQPAVADFDRDGYPDIVWAGAQALPLPVRLLLNNGHGVFSDQASPLLGPDIVLESWDPQWVDVDNDGWLDLWLPAIRSGGEGSRLLMNIGGTSFSDADTSSTQLSARSAITSGWADFDNDGDMDLFLIPYVGDAVGNAKFYRNNGNMTFTNIINGTSLDSAFTNSRGVCWGDFDNDGWQDLLIGRRTSPQCLFRNNGDGTFTDVGAATQANVSGRDPRTATFVDYDNDGFLDIFLTGQDTYKWLLHNGGSSNHWIGISLFDSTCANTAGIGARVCVVRGSRRQIRDIQSGSGSFSNGYLRAHFGLGSEGRNVDSVIIRWPSGRTSIATNVAIDRYHSLRAPQLAWQSSLRVSDACNTYARLFFGQAPGATDGIDPLLGEAELPPMPPAGILDSRFVLPSGSGSASLQDFRGDTLKGANWRITFQGCAYPFTFRWDSAGLPRGSFFLKDEASGTIVKVDMKSQGSYSLANTGLTSLMIEFHKEVCKSIPVASGWNMVSVPVSAASMAISAIFPGATSLCFAYNNGYVQTTQLSVGVGYWLKFATADSSGICGMPTVPGDVALSSGWNMIGVYDADAQVSGLSTTPPGIISSNFFGYSNGYVIPTILKMGKGYWVKASQTGVLHLPFSLPKTEDRVASINASWTRVEVTDATGQRGMLYLSQAGQMPLYTDLPPTPPAGILDVRYSGDRFIEAIGSRHELQISSAVYPVVIVASNLQGISPKLKDEVNGLLLDDRLEEGRAVTLQRNVGNLLLEESAELPTSFELSQNYPNPFNPTTVVRYQLPVASSVKLVVYDLLGREVSVLVNETLNAGRYTREFDASGLASGVYPYRLTAGSFTAARKMAVVR